MLTTAGALRWTAGAKVAAGCSSMPASVAPADPGHAPDRPARPALPPSPGQNSSASSATAMPPSTEPAMKSAYCRRVPGVLMAWPTDGRVKALVYNARLTGPQGSADLVAGFRPETK